MFEAACMLARSRYILSKGMDILAFGLTMLASKSLGVVKSGYCPGCGVCQRGGEACSIQALDTELQFMSPSEQVTTSPTWPGPLAIKFS